MSENPISLAVRTRELNGLGHRLREITRRYGLTTYLIDRSLFQFFELLKQFDCPATLPITALPFSRNHQKATKYRSTNIELAVHGYTHIDYSQSNNGTIGRHLQAALKIFTQEGISPTGFRSPYLSRSDKLYSALAGAGFCYVSNQPFLWEGIDLGTHSPAQHASYARALSYYNPWKSGERLSLPRQMNGLVEIPVTLPDDEILVDRLGGSSGLATRVWLNVLSQSYQRGELFTLQLHPERTALCADSLAAVLAEARQRKPGVWCAQLDEVAAWWNARSQANLIISNQGNGDYNCLVNGPENLTVLVRGVMTDVPSSAWMNGYRVVKEKQFHLRSPLRPLIGVPLSSPSRLITFLQHQGFAVELSPDRELYGCYIDDEDFVDTDERRIMEIIDSSNCQIVRLGFWPNGYASAMCVTGDIDAFTLWDFGMRILGR
jgi:peptidoglycan/xylan/chitin deacetylase (PgdA/CDA1 family)